MYGKVGLIAFSKDAKVEFYLNSYRDKSALLAAIGNVGYMAEITNTHLALDVRHTGIYYMLELVITAENVKNLHFG